MNILLTAVLCLICFGGGWLWGIKNGKDIEKMVDGVEKGVAYLDSLDFESYAAGTTSTYIDLLLHLDTDEGDDAREYLILILKDKYKDMQENLADGTLSDETKIQMDRLTRLSQKHDAFKSVVSE